MQWDEEDIRKDVFRLYPKLASITNIQIESILLVLIFADFSVFEKVRENLYLRKMFSF